MQLAFRIKQFSSKIRKTLTLQHPNINFYFEFAFIFQFLQTLPIVLELFKNHILKPLKIPNIKHLT